MTAPVTAPELGVAEVENPAAFPSVCLGDPCHPASLPGMTLRDWFAGQALSGTFHHETDKAINTLARSSGREENDLRAQYSYELADAMLALRSAAEAARSGGEG